MTWIFNRTNGNLLTVILFHGSLNAHSAFIEREMYPPLYDQEDTWLVFYLLFVLILGIISYIKMSEFSGDISEDTPEEE
jgi:hypothetical protein